VQATIWIFSSKTADPSVLAALRILQLFYDQVKIEVCSASEGNARDSDTFHFLSALDDETCRSVVARYGEFLWFLNLQSKLDLTWKFSVLSNI
jgi:hypothetical protein